jgi:hypothetical protein
MSSVMTGATQRDAVRRLVSQSRVSPPREQVVDMGRVRLGAAVLAYPVVAIQDSGAIRLVGRRSEVSSTSASRAARPLRVGRSYQMGIPGWGDASGFDAATNCGSVCIRQRPSAQCLCNAYAGLTPSRLGHQLPLTPCCSCLLRNLLADFRALGDVVGEVLMDGAA